MFSENYLHAGALNITEFVLLLGHWLKKIDPHTNPAEQVNTYIKLNNKPLTLKSSEHRELL